MRLLRAFSFTDPDGQVWDARINDRTDGASIPRALWSLIGSPFTGNYRRAAILHDVACDRAGDNYEQRLAADRMFYHGCRAGGCTWYEATLLYIGVRIGAYLPFVNEWRPAKQNEWTGPRLHLAEEEDRVQRDFRRISERVLSQGEADNAAIVEKRTEEAVMQTVAVRQRK